MLGRARNTVSYVFRDRLKGKPYSDGDYDGIDVSKHNGVIRWKEVAEDKRIKFVFIKATEGICRPVVSYEYKAGKGAGLIFIICFL